MGLLPSMSVGSAMDSLAAVYHAAVMKGTAFRTLPSVMLWGAPGVGKSQGVRQLAKDLEEKTGKRVVVTDVRLLLFNPIDLRGIPTANEDKTLAVWLKPQIFRMDEGDDVINILFLDELSAAPPSVQAAAYQITLDRVVGEHKLPENCIVIAAGNRVTDRSVAYKMPKALANRLLHLEVEVNFESWKTWATKNGIHYKVVGFLSFRSDYLMKFDPSNDDLAFATPRAWEMVSALLHCTGQSPEELYPLIAGMVGTGMALELRTWDRVYRELPKLEDIFDGKTPPLPKTPEALYALTAAMTDYARAHRHEISRIANSISYADRMTPDFSALVMRDYMYLERDYKQVLMGIPAFVRWYQTKGRLLNGHI